MPRWGTWVPLKLHLKSNPNHIGEKWVHYQCVNRPPGRNHLKIYTCVYIMHYTKCHKTAKIVQHELNHTNAVQSSRFKYVLMQIFQNIALGFLKTHPFVKLPSVCYICTSHWSIDKYIVNLTSTIASNIDKTSRNCSIISHLVFFIGFNHCLLNILENEMFAIFNV